MFGDLLFQWKLRRLEKRRQRTMSNFQNRFADAVEKKETQIVREGLRNEERLALDEWDDDIDVLTTADLLQQAQAAR